MGREYLLDKIKWIKIDPYLKIYIFPAKIPPRPMKSHKWNKILKKCQNLIVSTHTWTHICTKSRKYEHMHVPMHQCKLACACACTVKKTFAWRILLLNSLWHSVWSDVNWTNRFAHSLNWIINYKAVYRIAPATPGLFKNLPQSKSDACVRFTL